MKTKYPEITVKLSGQDGNAFLIIGRVQKAMKQAKVPKEEIDRYINEATKGDYDALLRTTMEWVNVE